MLKHLVGFAVYFGVGLDFVDYRGEALRIGWEVLGKVDLPPYLLLLLLGQVFVSDEGIAGYVIHFSLLLL